MNAVAHDPTAEPTAESRIVAALLEKGRLKDGDLARARPLHREAGGSLLQLLVRLGLVSERDHAQTSAEVLGLPLLDAKAVADAAPEALLDGLPLTVRFLKQFHVCPLALHEGVLSLWVADPQDPYAADAVRLAMGVPVRLQVGLRSEIDDLIERWFGQGRSAMGAIIETADGEGAAVDDIEHLRDLASEAPVIRLVNLVIQRAVELRASDIHIEPFENRLKVRYRIDGVLIEGESPPVNLTAAVISRIKIMARLNIAERRLPQDGRIMLRVQGKELDLRVSTVPTAHGESVVMRLLDRDTVVFDFHRLGFTDAFLPQFRKVLEQPHGILLVTGPTGSGKTTTLYSTLKRLATPDVNVCTVEDPIEMIAPEFNQMQVQLNIDLDFASGVRTLLRQDPDIIMIGEIRDLETAQMAVQASLTGHLVLSTLHTNDAPSAITRLLDLGVPHYLLASTLNGVLAQRLVRTLCPSCKVPKALTAEHWAVLADAEEALPQAPTPYAPVGCIECRRTGYLGRIGLYELLPLGSSLRRLIRADMDLAGFNRAARAEGVRTLRRAGLEKVAAGLTTIEEVLSVLPPPDEFRPVPDS